MSIYSTGRRGLPRSTAKWLIGLVLLASLAAAAAVVAPRFVTGKTAAGSWSAWIATYYPVLLGCGRSRAGGHLAYRRLMGSPDAERRAQGRSATSCPTDRRLGRGVR